MKVKLKKLIPLMAILTFIVPILMGSSAWAVQVVGNTPENKATEVAINAAITATFDVDMNASTITTDTFYVETEDPSDPLGYLTVEGQVSYDSDTKTATWQPTSGTLTADTRYYVTVKNGSGGVKDASGNALDIFDCGTCNWTFTTGTGIAPPAQITETNPANGAANVPVSTVLTVTFTNTMNSSTITPETFYVEIMTSAEGEPPVYEVVPGQVTYNATDKTATWQPTEELTLDTTYYVTLAGGANGIKDANGIPIDGYNLTFTTGVAASALTVVSTTPAADATDVAVGTAITATFSTDMDSNTISDTTFTVNDGSADISGQVAYDGTTKTATFTPDVALAYGRAYMATVSTGAADLNGNTLEAPYSWTFTTGTETGAPTVTSTSPADAETGVDVGTVITATFSEDIDETTLAGEFTVNGVNGQAEYDSDTMTATFTPDADLAYNTTYTAAISTGVTDLDGNAMEAEKTWSFTTVPEGTPTVTGTTPADAATDVPMDTSITATFSEDMDQTTLPAAFTVNDGSADIAGTVTYDGTSKTATFTPLPALANYTPYTATITTGAQSAAGVAMAADKIWSFTTGAAAAGDTPTVTSTTPADAAAGVALDTLITATFSLDMDGTTITDTTFTVNDGSSNIEGTVSYADKVATFTPIAPLASDMSYTATITTGAASTAGLALAADKTWSFTTGLKGDINGDGRLDLKDAIYVLRVLTSLYTTGQPFDVDGDGKIGIPEAVYVLTELAFN